MLGLMRELAVVEGYIDEFAVTQEALIAHGFGSTPTFQCLVAEAEGAVVGMAVFYFVPFTWSLQPTVLIKELFVQAAWRRSGIATSLMRAIAGRARLAGCGAMRWSLTAGESAGHAFSRSIGGYHDERWQPWTAGSEALERAVGA